MWTDINHWDFRSILQNVKGFSFQNNFLKTWMLFIMLIRMFLVGPLWSSTAKHMQALIYVMLTDATRNPWRLISSLSVLVIVCVCVQKSAVTLWNYFPFTYKIIAFMSVFVTYTFLAISQLYSPMPVIKHKMLSLLATSHLGSLSDPL